MMSSLMPSLKYSCSRSRLMLAKGRTTIEGRSGSDGATEAAAASVAPAATSPAGPSSSDRERNVRVAWSDSGNGASGPAGAVKDLSRCILRTSTSATTMATPIETISARISTPPGHTSPACGISKYRNAAANQCSGPNPVNATTVPTAAQEVTFLAAPTQIGRIKRPNCGAMFAIRIVGPKPAAPDLVRDRPPRKGYARYDFTRATEGSAVVCRRARRDGMASGAQ